MGSEMCIRDSFRLPGYLADFVIIDNFQQFNILQVFKKGVEMYDGKEVKGFRAPEIDPYLSSHP